MNTGSCSFTIGYQGILVFLIANFIQAFTEKHGGIEHGGIGSWRGWLTTIVLQCCEEHPLRRNALNKTLVGKTAFFCKLLLYWSKYLHVLLQLVFNRTVSLKEDPGKSVWRPGEVGVNCVPCTLVVSIYSFILCIAARTLLTWINSKITF